MNSIINIGPSVSFPMGRSNTPQAGASSGVGTAVKAENDPLGFSAVSYSIPPDIMEQVSLRLAKTNAIRSEIEAGTYETKERIQGAVERLIDIII